MSWTDFKVLGKVGLCIVLYAMHWKATEQSNILSIFPHRGYSHFRVFYPILHRLAENGHKVTVVTFIKTNEVHPNYEELLLNGSQSIDIFSLDDHKAIRSLGVMFQETWILHVEGQQSCQAFYESGHVETIFKRHSEKPYDLVIMEFFNSDCCLGIPHLLQVPIVGISSCALMPWHYSRVALPDNPSYIQSEFIGFPEQLNWLERLKNFITVNGNKIAYRFTQWRDNQVIKRYLNIDVDVEEVAASTSLLLVNQHFSLNGNRPLTAQVKEIGGVHITPEELNPDTICDDVQHFLNSSNETTLLISFGSLLKSSTLPKNKFSVIVAALKRLNVRVIWRWGDENVPLIDDKFLFVKWIPQLALLCHPRVGIFWSHGGNLGVTEAVYCGKPLVVTPFYGDQFLNGHAIENRKIGKILPYNDISEKRVFEVFQEILRHRYKENVMKLSKAFQSRESSPLASSVWWIEYVLSSPTASELLRTKAVHMNWFTYHSIDSVIMLLCIILLVCAAGYLLLRLLRPRRNETKKIKYN